jgi:thymidine kinase
VAIDDAHFFIDISTFSDQLANQGKHIIIAGLDSTF